MAAPVLSCRSRVGGDAAGRPVHGVGSRTGVPGVSLQSRGG